MIGTIVGFEKIEYVNKDGKEVKGLRLYYTYEDDSVSGKAADTVYLSNSSPAYFEDVKIGCKYDFNYQVSSFAGKTRLVSIKPVA